MDSNKNTFENYNKEYKKMCCELNQVYKARIAASYVQLRTCGLSEENAYIMAKIKSEIENEGYPEIL